MHEGRRTGWSGQLDWPEPPDRGKHRRTSTEDSGPPARRAITPSSRTNPTPRGERLGGLPEFDLGMIPASVTPPRSWRRAAWFTIVSSAAAFFGIVLTAAALVGPPAPARLGAAPPAVPDPELGAMSLGSAGESTLTVTPSTPLPYPPLAPVVSDSAFTPPASEPVLGDLEELRQRTERYFELIQQRSLRSAFALTTGGLHASGYSAFADRYPETEPFEVAAVAVYPARAVVTLHVTEPDGTVTTTQRELRFTVDGKTAKIDADARLT